MTAERRQGKRRYSGAPAQIPLTPAAGFIAEAPEAAPYPLFPHEDVLEKWSWAIGAPIKSAPEKAILGVLAYHARKRDGVAWPSRDTMAAETGLGSTTIKRALRSLEERGWLVRLRRAGQTTRYRPKSPVEEVCSRCLGAGWCACAQALFSGEAD